MSKKLSLMEEIVKVSLREMGTQQFFTAVYNAWEVVDWLSEEECEKVNNLVNNIIDIVEND
jgi:hypothetical protein